ncbi:4Fe-4S binding protein [uncultured Cetobacterium sp.]|uniref:4Fe-4S binding protein n=1 Tax=uncultured Cetobacterium sp. TaxID=527638 RepID=UPI0025FF726D|nr:4Fe-4S binding protein [uncultured Cetobacterium sp.]
MDLAKFKVSFNKERCKGCGLCTLFCPMKIVHLNMDEMNSKGYNVSHVTDEEKCVGCTNCAMMCPDSVISIDKI